MHRSEYWCFIFISYYGYGGKIYKKIKFIPNISIILDQSEVNLSCALWMSYVGYFIFFSFPKHKINLCFHIIFAHFFEAKVPKFCLLFRVLWVKALMFFAIKIASVISKPNIEASICYLKCWGFLSVQNKNFWRTEHAMLHKNHRSSVLWIGLIPLLNYLAPNMVDFQDVAILCSHFKFLKSKVLFRHKFFKWLVKLNKSWDLWIWNDIKRLFSLLLCLNKILLILLLFANKPFLFDWFSKGVDEPIARIGGGQGLSYLPTGLDLGLFIIFILYLAFFRDWFDLQFSDGCPRLNFFAAKFCSHSLFRGLRDWWVVSNILVEVILINFILKVLSVAHSLVRDTYVAGSDTIQKLIFVKHSL